MRMASSLARLPGLRITWASEAVLPYVRFWH
jgi:hypothetical protein